MTQMGHAKAGTPPSDTSEIHLTQQLTLTNLVNEAGLSEIARAAGPTALWSATSIRTGFRDALICVLPSITRKWPPSWWPLV